MSPAFCKVTVSTPFRTVTWVCANCPAHGDNTDTETPYVHCEITGHTAKVLTVSLTTYAGVRE